MTLSDLIDRVEQGSGEDREIDVAVVYALHPDIGPYQGQCIGDAPIFWHEPYRKQPAPHFTASVDAVTALAERLVPGWQVRGVLSQWTGIHRPGNGVKCHAWLRRAVDSYISTEGNATTEPRALLAAVLRAVVKEADITGRTQHPDEAAR